MNSDERREALLEAKQFALASPVLTPLIARMKKTAYERLLGAYRDGAKDYTNLIGELFVIQTLEREITTKEQYYTTLMKEGAKDV